jgi:hypothetical protein
MRPLATTSAAASRHAGNRPQARVHQDGARGTRFDHGSRLRDVDAVEEAGVAPSKRRRRAPAPSPLRPAPSRGRPGRGCARGPVDQVQQPSQGAAGAWGIGELHDEVVDRSDGVHCRRSYRPLRLDVPRFTARSEHGASLLRLASPAQDEYGGGHTRRGSRMPGSPARLGRGHGGGRTERPHHPQRRRARRAPTAMLIASRCRRTPSAAGARAPPCDARVGSRAAASSASSRAIATSASAKRERADIGRRMRRRAAAVDRRWATAPRGSSPSSGPDGRHMNRCGGTGAGAEAAYRVRPGRTPVRTRHPRRAPMPSDRHYHSAAELRYHVHGLHGEDRPRAPRAPTRTRPWNTSPASSSSATTSRSRTCTRSTSPSECG